MASIKGRVKRPGESRNAVSFDRKRNRVFPPELSCKAPPLYDVTTQGFAAR